MQGFVQFGAFLFGLICLHPFDSQSINSNNKKEAEASFFIWSFHLVITII